MLVVHFQYHALVMHFQCCVCFALLQHHACFACSISCLFCICNVATVMHIPMSCFFCTFNVVLILQSLVSNFDIQQWWAIGSLACVWRVYSSPLCPLKVIMLSNINGTLRTVHFNNTEWWWWRLLRKFTLVICVEKKHEQVKWICVADSWMLQEYFYWA
jgi:hypothetical protein